MTQNVLTGMKATVSTATVFVDHTGRGGANITYRTVREVPDLTLIAFLYVYDGNPIESTGIVQLST